MSAYKRAVLERFFNETDAKIAAARARITAKAIAGALNMPGLGGKTLGEEIRVLLLGAKKQIEDLKTEAAGAVIELVNEIGTSKGAVKSIREETAALKAAFADVVGNGEPAATGTANPTAGRVGDASGVGVHKTG